MPYFFREAWYSLPEGTSTFGIIWLIFQTIALWKVFEKAGEAGWKSLIPFYNLYSTFKIAWGKGWMFLWLIVPLVNLVFLLMLPFKMARAFGKARASGWGCCSWGRSFTSSWALATAGMWARMAIPRRRGKSLKVRDEGLGVRNEWLRLVRFRTWLSF